MSSNDSYTTVSENSTTDTSILEESDSDGSSCCCSRCGSVFSAESLDSDDSDSAMSVSDSEYSDASENSEEYSDAEASEETDSAQSETRDSNLLDVSDDWDVTNESLGIPSVDNLQDSPFTSLFGRQFRFFTSPRNRSPKILQLEDPRSKVAIYKEQTFRERAWSLEECSICFEVMLRDQELVKLPCTHNFHLACIGPWLEQQQTCPMCRKSAE